MTVSAVVQAKQDSTVPLQAAPGLALSGAWAESSGGLRDATMLHLYRLIDSFAESPLPVLVMGETGVGKEVYARTLHARSSRAGQPFLRAHCAACSEAQWEGELFGAEPSRAGLFECADSGTVLLDEVGELSLPLQARLLRFLESGEVVRVGGVTRRRVDVRLICATHRDLEAEVAAGRFRADLFFRLAGLGLYLPPLRQRPDDIEVLARYFLERSTRRLWGHEARLLPSALQALRSHPWPGNIRQLHHVMERAAVFCGGLPVGPEHLALSVLAPSASPRAGTMAQPPGEPPSLRAHLVAAERQHILEALEQCAGNQTRAARLLQLSRRGLLKKLDALGLPRPRKKGQEG